MKIRETSFFVKLSLGSPLILYNRRVSGLEGRDGVFSEETSVFDFRQGRVTVDTNLQPRCERVRDTRSLHSNHCIYRKTSDFLKIQRHNSPLQSHRV